MHFCHCLVCFDTSIPDVAYVQQTKAQPVFSQPTSIVLLSCFPSASSSCGSKEADKSEEEISDEIYLRENGQHKELSCMLPGCVVRTATRSQSNKKCPWHEVTQILHKVSRAENRASAQIRGLRWLLSSAKSSRSHVEYKFENYKPFRRWLLSDCFRRARMNLVGIDSVCLLH